MKIIIEFNIGCAEEEQQLYADLSSTNYDYKVIEEK